MKSRHSPNFLPQLWAAGIWFTASIHGGSAATAPADRAQLEDQINKKYSAMGYYLEPVTQGRAGFGVSYTLNVPVNRGVEYVFIVDGDEDLQDVELWVEAEETGNTIVKDTRRTGLGEAGVRWTSDYNGTVSVVVHFVRVTNRCSWSALMGRRSRNGLLP